MVVACVLRSGGIYEPWHVHRLQRMVEEWLPGVSMVCLTDSPASELGCEAIPLETDWPGWWAKLELFRHDFGPVAYLDLDVVIQDDIGWLRSATQLGELAALRDFFVPRIINSSVMAWDGPRPEIAEGFRAELDRRWRDWPDQYSDQSWILRRVPDAVRLQDRFPGQVASAKRPQTGEESIVVYHGRPKPWD